jgi:hypothetical protein
VYFTKQSDVGQVMGDSYNAQLPLSESEVDAMRRRFDGGTPAPDSSNIDPGSPGSGPLSAAQRLEASRSRAVFPEADQGILRRASNVFVLGYSSMGGGHTFRSLEPLRLAIEQGVIGKGDAILIVKPPHYENDTGNELNQLTKFRELYKARGVDVIEVQQDRAVLGFYKPDGPSDNPRILDNFVEMDARDPLDNRVVAYANYEGQMVDGFDATAIMKQAVEAAGSADKFTVFTDMDPYTNKGASEARIPAERIIDQSNHIGLMAPNVDFKGKSYSYLTLANGDGFAGKTALIGFTGANSLGKLLDSFDQLGISSRAQKQAVRQDVISRILQDGKRLSLQAPVDTGGGVLLAQDANAGTIDGMVTMYLNKYTGPLGEHIQNKLNEAGDNPYKHTLFVIAGRNMLPGFDAMDLSILSTADLLIAGGMGTTTEWNQLINHGDYQGKAVVVPVEDQHEQQANANFLLPASVPDGTFTTARDSKDLREKLDALVANRTRTETLTEDLNQLHTMAQRPERSTDRAVALLGGGSMTEQEADLLTINNRMANVDALAERRIVNAVLPALQALVRGNRDVTVTVKMGPEYEAQTLTLRALADTLRDPERAAELLQADVSGRNASKALKGFANWLDRLEANPDVAQRRDWAQKMIDQSLAKQKYTLGY